MKFFEHIPKQDLLKIDSFKEISFSLYYREKKNHKWEKLIEYVPIREIVIPDKGKPTFHSVWIGAPGIGNSIYWGNDHPEIFDSVAIDHWIYLKESGQIRLTGT